MSGGNRLANVAHAPNEMAVGEVLPMVRPDFVPDDVLLAQIRAALESGRVTNDGPLSLAFERQIAAFLGADEAVLLNSGAMALFATVRALGLRGKVILPSFTYIATLAAFTENGLDPIFCDVDPETFTLSVGDLRRCLREGPIAGVAPVNAYGVHADLEGIAQAMEGSGAVLLYDNAHGFGTEDRGSRLPEEPLAQVFSLHATKVLPAVEGGVVVSRDPSLLREVRRLRGHGLTQPLADSSPGFNLRFDELRAAVGAHSLTRLPEAIARRRAYAARLKVFMAGRCEGFFQPQRIPDGLRTNFQNFAVRVTVPVDLDQVISGFRGLGIEARRYFWPPLHHLEKYRTTHMRPLPITDALEQSLLCLPLYSQMPESELQRIEFALQAVARTFHS